MVLLLHFIVKTSLSFLPVIGWIIPPPCKDYTYPNLWNFWLCHFIILQTKNLKMCLRILKWEDYTGLPRWAQCNHKGSSARGRSSEGRGGERNSEWGGAVSQGSLCVLSPVWLFVTPRAGALQPPLSMGFSRQEYWSGLLFLLQGIFPIQGLNLRLLLWQVGSLPLSHLGSQRVSKSWIRQGNGLSHRASWRTQPLLTSWL